MKPIIRKSSFRSSSAPSFYTYLKPGALAQIRYSKITAKSRLHDSETQLALYQQIPRAVIDLSTMDGIPCFNLRIRNSRPRCLQRQKLTAVAPIFTPMTLPEGDLVV
ncbi:hypothetical protein A4A49_14567 [Nicotiana attenuata]|uniref:Uncharacterized protein n=1 Tax=Nicotiana attenuata TaxID=49451 RepID=A0A1J6IFJ2_NICAT|nr:hypothetical protein A4A49_14567 [Nicotiana attenuata]